MYPRCRISRGTAKCVDEELFPWGGAILSLGHWVTQFLDCPLHLWTGKLQLISILILVSNMFWITFPWRDHHCCWWVPWSPRQTPNSRLGGHSLSLWSKSHDSHRVNSSWPCFVQLLLAVCYKLLPSISKQNTVFYSEIMSIKSPEVKILLVFPS